MNNYILIKGLNEEDLIFIDRVNYRIIELTYWKYCNKWQFKEKKWKKIIKMSHL